ncbi:MAG TPA: class I SAM-dependent methyltransferase, partial [Acidimicrobiales bacterium]|nr:class I SAM-dependent methyltransferase [Acidimicrobiales bacterium]
MASGPASPSEHATAWSPAEEGERYERGRPDYPAAIAPLLQRELRLTPGTRLADVAAGTGKLTRRLVETPATVLAVEPMPGMRAHLRHAAPSAAPVAARVEHLPLATGTVDAVTVAQAFHWFRLPAASRELRRVLRPGGRLAVVINSRDTSVPLVRRLWEILGRYEQ